MEQGHELQKEIEQTPENLELVARGLGERAVSSMIWYIPLEYIDRRYTKAMDEVIREELDRQGKPYTVIGNPDQEQVIPNKKDFLNSTGTNITRFGQLAEVAKLFAEGEIQDGDTFFFSDLWASGVEAIPYMAYFNDKKVRITGILHAGSFTPSDFVANMKYWAKDYEKAIIKMSDKVFLGSNQPLIDLIDQGYIEDYGNMVVTGIPISTEKMYELVPPPKKWEDKEDIVVFAGRLVDEKQPFLFDRLASQFPEYKFVKTLDLDLDKRGYYNLLRNAKLFVSFAKQENYGIAAVEAAAYGMNLLVPDALSYKDFYPAKFRYNPDLSVRDRELAVMLPRLMQEDNMEEVMAIADSHNDNVKKIIDEL